MYCKLLLSKPGQIKTEFMAEKETGKPKGSADHEKIYGDEEALLKKKKTPKDGKHTEVKNASATGLGAMGKNDENLPPDGSGSKSEDY